MAPNDGLIGVQSNQINPLRKCIILDLDATLISSTTDPRKFGIFLEIMASNNMELKSRLYHLSIKDVMAYEDKNRGQGEITEMWGVERPGLKTFLRWCFTYFSVVGVWSAGKKPYVEAICQKIFVGKGIRSPDITLTYNDCTGHYQSPLKNLRALSESDAGRELGITLENVVLVDDRTYSFSATPENGILIPPYDPDLTIESLSQNNQDLIKLGHWFSQSDFFTSSNVRFLNKEHIFNNT